MSDERSQEETEGLQGSRPCSNGDLRRSSSLLRLQASVPGLQVKTAGLAQGCVVQ
ncbi:hypothetical protein P7K49_014797, partial [Saguinus oedipus]